MTTALLTTPAEPQVAPGAAPGIDLATGYIARLLAVWDADPDRDVVLTDALVLTAGDLARRTRALAVRLGAAGVGPGTTVALLTVPNDPAMLTARWAAHRCGATVVHVRSMNPRTDEVELPLDAQADVLRTTRPLVLLTDDATSDRARRLVGLVPGTEVVALDDTDTHTDTHTDAVLPTHVDPASLALVDFTSGTVNAPKLVAQSWASRERLVARLTGATDPAGPTRFLSVTPISHTTAPMIDAALLGGGSVVLHPGFDVDAVLGAVTDRAVTDVYLAVPHLLALLDDGRLPTTDLTGLRRVVYSGTPSAAWRVRQAVAAFGGSLVQVYGATETGGISALTAEDHLEPELHGTVGRPFPWVEVEIRNDDIVVPAGGTGEIHVRSETVMTGYLGADDPHDAVADGWVATGDLGRWDRHGYLELLGRVGGVIKTGGLKIYPAAVEAALTQHPAVRQAVVEGRRSCDEREHVHATISCAPGSCTPAELHDHVAVLLSESHAPTEFTFWSGIPLTDRGKPDYQAMRAADGGLR
ncbi:class I adenylate-forming enzyme family protein [Nocardioides plantarum]|uniref:Class I adenylate-forming enzyme family protein n=1 Tax=Nocardioides plantarum TaxID=29299 RepID=A0ABV5K4H2_9ACTN|nr:fatty acid--CoA ligase family protein [Nocardioides plantarum]